jgi:branched-chain amino acid transport system permease protein
MEGPVVGAIVFHLLQRYLAGFGAWYLMLLGTHTDSDGSRLD